MEILSGGDEKKLLGLKPSVSSTNSEIASLFDRRFEHPGLILFGLLMVPFTSENSQMKNPLRVKI